MYSICKFKAFTLVELIITLAILAILVTIAIPSFQSFRERQERAQVLPTVRQAISLARTNASLYRTQVVICSSSSLKKCEDNQWDKGMIIFLDQNKNKTLDDNEKIIQAIKTNYNYGSFTWTGGATSTNVIIFQPDSGLPRGSQGNFKYCAYDQSKTSLIVRLSQTGQTRLQEQKTC